MDHIIAKIGKGLKGAKDLTWEEAKFALNAIIEGQATEGQIGAFLIAMRIKPNPLENWPLLPQPLESMCHPFIFPIPLTW